jgi:hypothetical protein
MVISRPELADLPATITYLRKLAAVRRGRRVGAVDRSDGRTPAVNRTILGRRSGSLRRWGTSARKATRDVFRPARS